MIRKMSKEEYAEHLREMGLNESELRTAIMGCERRGVWSQ